MRQIVFLSPLLFATSLTAQTCPPVQIDEARRAALIEQQRAAANEMQAHAIAQQLWAIWFTAPDARAQELLDSGVSRLRISDFPNAIKAFDALIAYCPHYAEGYNQRAFAYFLQKDFAPALADLDKALERSPEHVGALSGRALTLMGLGREEEAQAQLREALTFNPWLSERHLLKEPVGTDL